MAGAVDGIQSARAVPTGLAPVSGRSRGGSRVRINTKRPIRTSSGGCNATWCTSGGWRRPGSIRSSNRAPSYADARANAVFLLLGTQNTPVGAELRGTTDGRWRGMAPGSQKDLVFFSIASAEPHPSQPIILCESAIDAISCWAIHPDHRCLSTAGARPNPQWLATLVGQGLQIYCGFDSDPTGDRAANAMIALYPAIQRLRPPRHD
jgi:hypothetical protein